MVETIPFVNAEEAWFWFVRSQKARMDGARFKDDEADVARPCEPDDLYRILMSLVRKKTLGRRHMKVLANFGMLERVPDARVAEAIFAHIVDGTLQGHSPRFLSFICRFEG